MKVSEPKRPKTDTFTDLHKEFAVHSHSEQQMDEHHAAWQAYAAGIRAEVLGEVRAVLAGRPLHVFSSGSWVHEGRAYLSSELDEAAFVRYRDALATLENPNE